MDTLMSSCQKVQVNIDQTNGKNMNVDVHYSRNIFLELFPIQLHVPS